CVCGTFSSPAVRGERLDGTPVVPVPVRHPGPLRDAAALTALAGPSTCRTPRWRDALRAAARAGGADPGRVLAETDASDAMEGLYIKVEEDGRTVARYKGGRLDFVISSLHSGTYLPVQPLVADGLCNP